MAASKTGVLDIPGIHVAYATHPGQSTANTATDEETVFIAPCACKVRRLAWAPRTAVTGQATHHFSLNFEKKAANGAGTTDLATEIVFDSGVDATALVPKEFTLSTTEATVLLLAGEVVTLKRTLVGNGLAMPKGTVIIEFEPR